MLLNDGLADTFMKSWFELNFKRGTAFLWVKMACKEDKKKKKKNENMGIGNLSVFSDGKDSLELRI